MRLPSHQESTGRGDADLLHLRHQQWSHPHKSVFHEKKEKLAVEIATEVEEAANTAKAQVYSRSDEVQMIHTKKLQRNHHQHYQKSPPPTKLSPCTTARCYRCGKNGHAMKDCRLSNAVCNFCGKKGHTETACITKQRSAKVNLITTSTINSLTDDVKEPSPSVAVAINNCKFPFLVDTGASCNMLSSSTYTLEGWDTSADISIKWCHSYLRLCWPRCDCYHRRWRCQLSDPAIYCHRPAGHPWYRHHQLPPADD